MVKYLVFKIINKLMGMYKVERFLCSYKSFGFSAIKHPNMSNIDLILKSNINTKLFILYM